MFIVECCNRFFRCNNTCYCVGMVPVISASHYQSRTSMYIQFWFHRIGWGSSDCCQSFFWPFSRHSGQLYSVRSTVARWWSVWLGQRVASWRPTGINVLCPLARHFILCWFNTGRQVNVPTWLKIVDWDESINTYKQIDICSHICLYILTGLKTLH